MKTVLCLLVSLFSKNTAYCQANVQGVVQDSVFPSTLGCSVKRTSATTLVVFPNASSSQPCIVRHGDVPYAITTPATVTISSGAGSQTLNITVNNAGVIKANWTAASGISCSGCTTAFSQSSAPVGEALIYSWQNNSGAATWQTLGSEWRSIIASFKASPIAGSCILVTPGGAGPDTIAYDVTGCPSASSEYREISLGSCSNTTATGGEVSFGTTQAATDCSNGTDQPELTFGGVNRVAYFSHTIKTGTTAMALTMAGWGQSAGSMGFTIDNACVVNNGAASQAPSYSNVGTLSIASVDFGKPNIGTLTGVLPAGCTTKGMKAYFRITSATPGSGPSTYGWEVTNISLEVAH